MSRRTAGESARESCWQIYVLPIRGVRKIVTERKAMGEGRYRLFSAENSVFSAKVRAYFRFKHEQGDLGPGYEDILVTPDLIKPLVVARLGGPVFSQIEIPGGGWLQDSSEIIDHLE